ncbi:MAG: trigger factor [Lentisphaerota bacterium]
MQISNLISESVKIEKQTIEPCLQEVSYTVPSDKVQQCFDVMAADFAKHVKMQGFREGKAPIAIVKKTHKKGIEEEMLKELVSTSIRKSMTDSKEDVLTYTFVKDKTPALNVGSDFSFAVRFNVAPEIQLPEYKGIKVQVEHDLISDETVQKRLEYYKDVYGKLEKVEDVAKEGDTMKVSYTSDAVISADAKESLKRLANSELNYFWINQNNHIPGIDKALTGTKKDDSISCKIDFPADYEETEIAGKSVNYQIKVLEVQRKAPITSDEELATKFALKSIDEVKERIKKQMEKESEGAISYQKKMKVLEVITQNLDFPLPPDMLNDMINNELNYIVNNKINQSANKEETTKELQEKKEELMQEAKVGAVKRIKNFLLLRKIGKLEDIKVSEEEVEKHIDSMSHYYGYKPEELRKKLVDSGNIEQVFDEVLISKVTDFIADNAVVELVPKKA